MLKELCMPFEVVTLEDRNALPKALPANTKLPLLVDEEKVFEGPSEIIDHLNDLEKFKSEWYKFQSDVCYCDENGNAE